MAARDKAIVVWNDNAGAGAAGAGAAGAGAAGASQPLRGACDAHFDALHVTAPEASDALRDARVDAPLVVAAGGDGTINTVINALWKAASPAALGVLPLGTGNDFCRSLGIPLDPYEALRLIVARQSRVIDLGVIDYGQGEERFGNVAAGGNADQMKQIVTAEMKAQWGALCYVRGAVAALANLQGYETRLKIDDEAEVVLPLWNIVIANGQFSGGGMPVAPGASVDDGWLDVVAVLDGTPIDVATLTANFVLGNFLEHERVRHWRAQRVTLTSAPSMKFSLDGETKEGERYEFRVVRQALSVLATPVR